MFSELACDDDDVVNCCSKIVMSTIRLGTSIFYKNVVNSLDYKFTEPKLRLALTKLNPEIIWKMEDILFLLRLVMVCPKNEQNGILQRILRTAKSEKSPAFLQKILEVQNPSLLLR